VLVLDRLILKGGLGDVVAGRWIVGSLYHRAVRWSIVQDVADDGSMRASQRVRIAEIVKCVSAWRTVGPRSAVDIDVHAVGQDHEGALGVTWLG
jgi:hypothetical protein